MKPREEARSRWARFKAIPPAVPLGLFAFWVILSGKMNAFHLGVGVVVVVLVVVQALSLTPLEAPGRPRPRVWRMVPYGGWLFWQMILSAVQVARVILAPGHRLNPQLIEFTCRQPSLFSRVMLAGSITLTPGTVTVDLDGDRFLVHTLTLEGAHDVLGGEMARRVAALSSDEPMPPIEVIVGPNAKGDEA